MIARAHGVLPGSARGHPMADTGLSSQPLPVDYNQWGPRFVHPRMLVDGQNVATAEVMMSPELAGFVSYQGPLLGVRYPLWQHPALTSSSTSRPASTSGHETSFPLDSSDTASPFDPLSTFGAMPHGDAEGAGREASSRHADQPSRQ